jgi:hypothetical protein
MTAPKFPTGGPFIPLKGHIILIKIEKRPAAETFVRKNSGPDTTDYTVNKMLHRLICPVNRFWPRLSGTKPLPKSLIQNNGPGHGSVKGIQGSFLGDGH